VKGLISPDEMMQKFGIDVDGSIAARKAAEEEAELKKAKKKKKKVNTNEDMFFEGG